MVSVFQIALAFTLMCHVAMSWDQSDRDTVLKMHNDYRRTTVQNGACHMNKVEYDMDMEKDAEAYAKRCTYQHKFDKYGENFAYDRNNKPNQEFLKWSVDEWYNEIKAYDYNQNACGKSKTCHYTQIVAANAKKMGCFMHFCPSLANAGPNANFMVCYYTPKGNWVGEKSYPKDCKSKCQEGQTEENGLCVGDAEGEGEEEFECKDSTHYCVTWKKAGQCDVNKSYMHKNCPVSCGVCTPEGPVAAPGCLDYHPMCPQYLKRGECTKRADQMKERCPKSCKFC